MHSGRTEPIPNLLALSSWVKEKHILVSHIRKSAIGIPDVCGVIADYMGSQYTHELYSIWYQPHGQIANDIHDNTHAYEKYKIFRSYYDYRRLSW